MIDNNTYNIQNDVAVVGIGLRAPSGNLKKSISKPNELYEALLNGLDGIVSTSERWSDNYSINGDIISNYAGLLPLEEWKQFDPMFFGINPSYDNVSSIDPQQRLLLKCTWEALEDAGIDPLNIRGSNTSTFIGSSTIDYNNLQRSPFETQNNIFGSSSHSVANRISFSFDLRGESLTIDTACSSSLNAINCGFNSIKSGYSSVSICGGVNFILDPHTSKSFSQLGLLSPTGKCHSFSSDADGYVRSEAVGIVVLKNLKKAIQDNNNIYCIIKGSSSNVDGNFDKLNFYSPSKSSQYQNIKLAIKSTNGQIKESDIDYCECHGTGTPTGDPIELEGISRVFKNNNHNKQVLVGSIKSNIGHAEACSGVLSLIKCCLMFKNRQFVPNINFKEPNPNIKFNEWGLRVVTNAIQFNENKKYIMAINNFGVTGSNACLILSEYNSHNNSTDIEMFNQNKKYLIPICANSLSSLENYKSNIINQSSSLDFNNFVNNQIKFKSNSLIQKSVIIASNWDEFRDQRNEIKSKSNLISNITVEKKKQNVNVMVFCGQGSQFNKMALSLYENEPIFKSSIDKIDKELSKYYGYSILEKLRSIKDDDIISIHQPILAQPANVMVQVSLYELYKHWGVKPDIIVGHSLGEVTSPYCSGMVDFETLCYITYHRSVAQNKTTGTGRMLSINISAEEYIETYSTKYPSLEFACFNSPSSVVIAGMEDLLNQLSKELKSKGIFCAMLGSLSSFHSSSQLMIKDEICSLTFKSTSPTVPVFSTVTSNLFTKSAPYNANYIFDNVLKPVNFTSTISNIYKYIESNDMGNEITFIEIAPHPTLQYYLNQMKSQQSDYFNKGQNISVYSPLNKKKNDYDEFLKTIASLYVNNGFNINFKSQFNNNNNNNKSIVNNLPLYSWDDSLYFKLNSTIEKIKNDGPSIQNLGNKSDSPLTSYQTFIDIKKPPFQWLKGHQVKNKCYYPGAGYVNNLLSSYPNQDITISSIEFKTPLVLVEGTNQCLQTTISPLSKNEFNVKSHYKDSKTDQWVLSSLGNFSLFKHGSDIGKINIKELKSICNFTKISKNDIYDTIRIRTDLTYKGAFQAVEEVYVGSNCSLSIVNVKNQNEFNKSFGNNNGSLFNAAILDTCLHGLLSFVQQQVVLDRIEGFKYYSSNIPSNHQNIKELYVYSEMKPRISPFTYSGSIKIMLDDGTLLIEISNVVCTSTSLNLDYDSSRICEPPSNEIYTPYQQSKDSIIAKPESFKHLYTIDEFSVKEEDNEFMSIESLLSLFYKHVNQRCNNINLELLSTIQYDQFKQLYFKDSINENLFIFIFENLKKYSQIYNSNNNSNNNNVNNSSSNNFNELFIRTTKIIAKQLIPLENDDPNIDTPESLFAGGFLDNFYQHSRVVSPLNNLLSEIIKETIKPTIKEPIIFRILEAGGGTGSLSVLILDKISKLLNEHPHSNIDIEFTWTDISASFFAEIKDKFSIFKGFNIIYRVLDLEKSLLEQDLKPSYYDMVVMSNVMHVVKHLKPVLNDIYKVLTPNGQLIYIEPPYKSIYYDSIFGCFSQWWPSKNGDNDLRPDRCCMKQEKWFQLLSECCYRDTLMSGNDNLVFLIQTRKPSINELIEPTSSLKELNKFNNIILFGGSNNNHGISNLLVGYQKQLSSNIIQINNYNEFNLWVDKSINSIKENKTLILFLKPLDPIEVNNFKQITFEYIQINQLILKLELSNNFKHVLLSLNSTSNNYLSSSIIGAARYFVEFPQLDLYILDFDNSSLNNNKDNLISLISYLINSDNNIQKEFTIKNNKVYYERYKRQSNIKYNFKSSSFENDKNQLYAQLDSNLEYKLYGKKQLKPNEVEVQVKSTGINYKDYLMYIGMISNSVDLNYGKEDEVANGGFNNNPNIGNDFSGVITRCGSDVKKLKVGDEVCGVATKSSSSHIIVDYQYVYNKPKNIDFQNSAAIPSIYVTTLHSIYNVGNLQPNQSILIHSAAGGVGLSALALLQYKQHKGCIFVTVGSKEKEEYLKEHYSSLITGIYSSRDKNYVSQIKNKLKELGCNHENQGLDLIINTLSSEFMDSNFQCLKISGRIVDLSITHLTPNDYLINNNFKYNLGYSNVEVVEFSGPLFRSYLKKIVKMVNSNKLNLIPIIEFPNDRFKDAIEHINQRIHIGKIIVNHDQDHYNKLLELHQQSNQIIMKHNYDISRIDIGKNILVTGQSGIILSIIKWLVKYSYQSINNIIILSKSKLKWELELLINQVLFKKDNIIKFHYFQIDIESSSEIKRVLDELQAKSNITNIESIIHFAFMNDIGDIKTVDMKRLDNAHGAKTLGAVNLHNESIDRSWNMKQFIMASSVVSVFGSDQQCCYVSACSVIDSLSKYRKSIGLPSLAVNLGAISQIGFVANNTAIHEMFRSSILKLFSPQLIISSLDLFIQNTQNYSNYCLSDFDFENLPSNISNYYLSKLDYQINIAKKSYKPKSSNSNSNIEESIKSTIINKISELLSIDETKINVDLQLTSYGCDSLSIVQLKNYIDNQFGHHLITIQQLQNNKISQFIEIIIKEYNIQNKSKDSNNINSNIKSNNNNKQLNIEEFIKEEIKLDDSIKSKPYSINQILNQNKISIFLTGSTGFLGAYLLSDLVKMDRISKVYCLTRNKSNSLYPIDDIINNLKKHQLYSESTDEEPTKVISVSRNISKDKLKMKQDKLNEQQLLKIIPVVGNISKDKFGLSSKDYSTISNECDIIINSAADLDLQSNYNESKTVNVNGVKELIKFSVSNDNKQKPLVHFTSIAVFVNHIVDFDEFDEQTVLPKFGNTPVGYMQSKIISEHLLRNAAESLGIPSIIIRPPDIWSNPTSGIGHSNDIVALTVQCSSILGYYPDLQKNIFTTPVTTISKNSINLILNENSWKQDQSIPFSIYGLNGDSIEMKSFYEILEKNYNCKKIDFEKWKQLVASNPSDPCKRYSTFHSLKDHNFISNAIIPNSFKMSNKTKELLKSIRSYNEQEWTINESMVLNNINHYVNK